MGDKTFTTTSQTTQVQGEGMWLYTEIVANYNKLQWQFEKSMCLKIIKHDLQTYNNKSL
jgi:hypothetical protein